MFDVVLLAADAEDIIRIVFIILVVGFSVISKFIGSFVETKNPPTGAPRRPPSNRPPSNRPASQPSASGQGSAEAAAGTQSGRSQSARTPPDRTPAFGSSEARTEGSRAQALRSDRQSSPVRGREPVESPTGVSEAAGRPAYGRDSVRPPVSDALDQPVVQRPIIMESDATSTSDRGFRSSFGDRLGPQYGLGHEDQGDLTSKLGNADERVESRLESVFENPLGSLSQQEDVIPEIEQGTDAAVWQEQAAKPSLTVNPAMIAEMLRSPDEFRKAFVVSEILKRPEI